MPLSMDVKWYSKYVFLVGAILSFVDPITDILTLVEFYRTGHKTWFAVGLGFVVLPWVPYGLYYIVILVPFSTRSFNAWFLFAFNPFSAAVARLKMFFICLKNVNKIIGIQHDGTSVNNLIYSKISSFFEAVLESAPQFVIQLYVISVQDAPVSIIQMISLPVSFLSLVWTFTSVEEMWYTSNHPTDDICKIVKHKVLFFVTYLFLLSSRLVAVSYFTVSYKWWIISVLMFHSIIMTIVGYICFIWQKKTFRFASNCFQAVEFFVRFCIQWITDAIQIYPVDRKRMRWFSNALFVVENLVMILLFYFSRHSNTWYALPVTVCVCSFTVLGTIMRITHFYFLNKDKEKQVTRNVAPPVLNFSDNFLDFRYYYESAV